MDDKKAIKPAIGAVIIMAAILMAYGGNVNGGFHWDDIHSIVDNPAVRSPAAALKTYIDPTGFSVYRVPMVRPVTITTFALNHALFGFRPAWWHVFNMALSLLAALALMGVARRLLEKQYDSETAAIGALAAALVFAVHPLQSETLNYLSARSELLAGTLCIATLYLHMRRFHGNGGTIYAIFATATYAMALGSRESAISFPAVVMLMELANSGLSGKGAKTAAMRSFPYWGILVLYMLYRRVFLGSYAGGEFLRGPFDQAMISIWAVGLYHKLILFPRGLSVHHFAPDNIQVSALFWVGLAAIVVEAIAFVKFWRKQPLVSFAIGLFYLGSSVTLVIPLNIHASEHRLFFAISGPALSAGMVLAEIAGGRKRVALGVLLAVTIVLALMTRNESRRWRNELTLWRSAVEVDPRDELAWTLYGKALKDANRIDEAISAYKAAIAIEPNGGTYNNLAIACEIAGDDRCAHEAILKAVELEPDNATARMNLALTLAEEGRLDEAESHMRKAIELQPVFPEAHRNLAALLAGKHPVPEKEILKHLELSLDQDPYQEDAGSLRKTIEYLRARLDQRQ